MKPKPQDHFMFVHSLKLIPFYSLRITLSFVFLAFIPLFIYANNAEIDSLQSKLKNCTNDYDLAQTNLHLSKLYERIDLNLGKKHALEALHYQSNDSILAETYNQLGRNYFYRTQLDSAIYYFEKTKDLLTNIGNTERASIVDISLGAIYLRQGNYNLTIEILTESATYFEEVEDDLNAAKCYSNIASAMAELGKYDKAIEFSNKALSIFKTNNLTQYQLITLPNLAAQYYKVGDTVTAIKYNLEAEELAKKQDNTRSLSIIYNNLGSIYLDKDPEKAKYYLNKTIALKKQLNLVTGLEVTLGNLGYIHLKNKEFTKALHYYNQVAEKVNGTQLVFAYDQIAKCYKGLNQFAKALNYAELSRTLNDSLMNAHDQKVFNEIQTKYETQKAKRELSELQVTNLEIDIARNRNRIFLFIVLALLIVSLLFGYIHQIWTKRKQLLIKQEFKIKEQEVEQILKRQELQGIDAIIDAQEKERSRIANDLHDNLGSKIATLKLYIEGIKALPDESIDQIKPELDHLQSLSEDTYQEIRKIAHNKNTNALIAKGLITATQTIANQISESNQLQIEVINVDVDDKININSTIEIQLFRIIQELLTNVIKHAKASECIIQFSIDENQLVLILEDNGTGFDIKEIKIGYGLTNIEKRIDKLNGQFNIDSAKNNGTTVILKVPL
ncbi:tetratricopeptide repeat-containing sensor histidine kinase [Carboxylicivirga linearis]|uniref:histidine kinase n=1 Tax=Carboxylicivirga linearis TaxID=1628157 RepID=A0ABS5JR28_9BACT|nr:sensor histidine kinase [Carboxylicivirga linearis]MBS2097227.1 sensor histidine kinase [Carboxylicivirga linearis]